MAAIDNDNNEILFWDAPLMARNKPFEDPELIARLCTDMVCIVVLELRRN